PGVTGGRQVTPHQQHRLSLVAVRRVHVVLGAHTKAPDAGIEPGLFQQNRTVSRGVDDNACAQDLASRAYSHYSFVLEYWSFSLSPNAQRRSRFNRPTSEE